MKGQVSAEQETPRKSKAKTSPSRGAPKAAKASPKQQQQPSRAQAQHASLPLSGGRQSVRYVVKSSFAPDVIARAAGTERHGRKGAAGPMHPDENAPENETAEERRLRRNRINERRKRARRAMKIDYLNEVCEIVLLHD